MPHQPLRTCVVTREQHPKHELIRIARQPDGRLLLDGKNHSLPGRGAYVKRDASVVEQMFERRALQRSFRMAITQEQQESLRIQFKQLFRKGLL